jgi:hypothetical protein
MQASNPNSMMAREPNTTSNIDEEIQAMDEGDLETA